VIGWRSIGIGVVIGALVAGLGATTGMAAAARDTVVIAQGTDITNGDPHRTTSTYGHNVLANIYETLLNRDANLHLARRRWAPGARVR